MSLAISDNSNFQKKLFYETPIVKLDLAHLPIKAKEVKC